MKKYIPAVTIVAIFILSSFVSQEYSDAIGEMIFQHKIAGLAVYFIAVILAIVVAPLTSIPFVPIVVGSWGFFLTAAASIISWTIGSIIAFLIARKYGAPIVKKLITITDKDIYFYGNIPEKRMFWYLIFLRIIVPVDILSYMLGLFTNIGWKLFTITTFLGVIPVIVFLALFGSFPVKYQIIFFLGGVVLIVLFFIAKRVRKMISKK